MEIIAPQIGETYSCKNCQRGIEKVNPTYPFCSYKCRFRLIYHTLMDYEKEDLLFIGSKFNLVKNNFKIKRDYIFALTKLLVLKIK